VDDCEAVVVELMDRDGLAEEVADPVDEKVMDGELVCDTDDVVVPVWEVESLLVVDTVAEADTLAVTLGVALDETECECVAELLKVVDALTELLMVLVSVPLNDALAEADADALVEADALDVREVDMVLLLVADVERVEVTLPLPLPLRDTEFDPVVVTEDDVDRLEVTEPLVLPL
jgi:hypothetical protein